MTDVKAKEEEALITYLKELALERCRPAQRAYAECVRGRFVSVAWACRDSAGELNSCLSECTNKEALADLKERWLRAGKPSLAGARLDRFGYHERPLKLRELVNPSQSDSSK
eukprot:CAMPEP_0170134122 /NCGR_PEP_ID=MMETSP0033_2-20121228/1717_1 /TAXON_ID=195969 /ORGANISM="Dolichomastix tenuilepis, Strain CCMP3274" /LENGTH=111 /DNA_ID=CAMNT_0010369663 /DNA_START=1 /DNA_END=333 /DNA_ORIENTATION=+